MSFFRFFNLYARPSPTMQARTGTPTPPAPRDFLAVDFSASDFA